MSSKLHKNRSGATRGPADRTTRIWCGTIRLGSNDDLGAACAAALPVGTKNEVERAAGFDVVVPRCRARLTGRNASPLSRRGCRARGPLLQQIAQTRICRVCEIDGGGQGLREGRGGAEGRRRDRNVEIRREVGLLRGVCG